MIIWSQNYETITKNQIITKKSNNHKKIKKSKKNQKIKNLVHQILSDLPLGVHNDFHRSHVRGSPFWKLISSLFPFFFLFFWYGRYSTWEVWNDTWLFMVAYRFSIDPISYYPCMEVYDLCSRWQMWMVHDNRHGEISFQHRSHCIYPPSPYPSVIWYYDICDIS